MAPNTKATPHEKRLNQMFHQVLAIQFGEQTYDEFLTLAEEICQ
jgi:hypothetical protein